MSNESDAEKTEPATPRRLEKAREDGQVPRSRELATFLLLCVGLASLWLMSSWMGEQMMTVMQSSMRFDAAMAQQPLSSAVPPTDIYGGGAHSPPSSSGTQFG